MPTKKPIVQAVLEKDIYDEYISICKEEDRSASNMTQYIIKKFIEEYKTTHKKLESLSSPEEIRKQA